MTSQGGRIRQDLGDTVVASPSGDPIRPCIGAKGQAKPVWQGIDRRLVQFAGREETEATGGVSECDAAGQRIFPKLRCDRLSQRGEAIVESDRHRCFLRCRLKFPAFPGGGTGGAGGKEGFAEIHANPYENSRPKVFGPALVSEPGNFRCRLLQWGLDHNSAHLVQSRRGRSLSEHGLARVNPHGPTGLGRTCDQGPTMASRAWACQSLTQASWISLALQ